MDFKTCKKYTESIIAAAPDWAKGKATIDSPEELVIIASHYNIDLPISCHHFRFSESPEKVTATGAHKTILRTLDGLKRAILATEKNG